ncbi:hypothetical protein D3C87_1101310 [compost metagenome]
MPWKWHYLPNEGGTKNEARPSSGFSADGNSALLSITSANCFEIYLTAILDEKFLELTRE